jgi:hypothetical protein
MGQLELKIEKKEQLCLGLLLLNWEIVMNSAIRHRVIPWKKIYPHVFTFIRSIKYSILFKDIEAVVSYAYIERPV